MTDKKESRKKSETEKKAEKDAMVNLWMNNLGTDDTDKSSENKTTEDKA